MSTRLTEQRPSSRRRDEAIGYAVAAVFYAAAMTVVVPALKLPAQVDNVTINNPHPWGVNIKVTDAERDGWVGIGPIRREAEVTFRSIIDQGDEWIFHFSYGGEDAELRLSAGQLERDNWQVTVPDELADELQAADVPETPE